MGRERDFEMTWTKGTWAIYASVMIGGNMNGCCCKNCFSQDAKEYMVEDNREDKPSANVYPLNPTPLEANAGTFENSQNNRLVRIRGKSPGGEPREFDVFFGPGESDLATSAPGKGRFTNADPGWQCTQGYAILRGIRPSGSTQYVKASSDSTTIILLVDKSTNEERVMVTQGKDAKVWAVGQAEPNAPNILKGQVIVAKISGGIATLASPVDYNTDKVSTDLLAYLKKVKGGKDIGLE